MKHINDSTRNSMKSGMFATGIAAFIIGIALIQQDSSMHFFALYFTQAVPIAITVGGLVFCISQIIKQRKRRVPCPSVRKEQDE